MEDTSKKIKKNYKLMGTENDPVIIAQRLLNLYRQLHIFNEEKREAFDKMLVEQTPEVKQILGTLPGGLVLQQYLEEVEEKLGLAVEHFEHENKPEQYAATTNSGSAAPVAGSVVVNSDPAAIHEIVGAFKDAIISSEKNRKEDTKELAQTLIALQSRLTQSILERQPVPVSVGEGGEIVHAPMPAVDEMIAGITKAQTELITELAHTQTQELSALISGVLKEIQQMSTQSLIDAVQTVHKENMDFFKNHIFSGVSLPDMASIKTDGKNLFKNIFQKTTEAKSESKEEKEIAPQPETPIVEPVEEEPISLSGEEDDCSFVYKEEPEPVMPARTESVSPVMAEETSYVQETEPQTAEDEYEWEYVDDTASEDEYEWEYVDENGNAITEEDNSASEEEYEWEYVDDGEYVEETEPAVLAEFGAEDVNEQPVVENVAAAVISEPEPEIEDEPEEFFPGIPVSDFKEEPVVATPVQSLSQSDDEDISLDLLLGDDEMSSATVLADEESSPVVNIADDPYSNPIDELLSGDAMPTEPGRAMSTKDLLAAYSKKTPAEEDVSGVKAENE